jgi:stress response protein YsnF
MPMLSEREVSAAVGGTAYGANGDKLGTVEHFFVDDRTGAPTWVSVTTGLFGTKHSVVPAVDAAYDENDGSLRLPVTAEAVKSAPHLAGDHLDPAEEAELRRHYGLEDDVVRDRGPAAGEPGWLPPVPPPATDRDDRTGLDDAATAAPTQEMSIIPPPPGDEEQRAVQTDGGMTRSEERLQVGTERVATTRARLVKYVVTEEVQITVPIRREEIRLEEVPLDAPDVGPGESLVEEPGVAGAGQGNGGYGTADALPDEIVLHTERPVVTVEVVPVERVRLRTETVEGQETVTERVQREQIVVDETPSPGVSPRRS